MPLGDVIDRGPNAKDAIAQLIALQTRCQVRPILGNHEEMMLSVIDGAAPQQWIVHGGVSTLESYGFVGSLDVISEEHVNFLRSFADFFENETHFFVHANYQPERSLNRQSGRSLRWTSLQERVPPLHISGKIAIVGHTADKSGELFSLPHLKCLDTYCYGGGWLTAYDVQSGRIWQANEQSKLRTRYLKDRLQAG